MEWRGVGYEWNWVRAFLATAEEGSLSAAARALGLAQPTLGRQVAALEAALGAPLFERVGRGLTLTPTGRDLLLHARAMGAAAEALALSAAGRAEALAGPVRVTASEAFAAYLLPPIVARIRRAAPEVTVEIVASNAITDLRRREADIAVRNARPTDPALIGRWLGDMDAALYASGAYLDARGPFDTATALASADFIGIGEDDAFRIGLEAHGVPVPVDRFGAGSASHLVHWELVRQGLGVGAMATVVGDRAAGVRRAAPWLAPFRFPVWLAAHRELTGSRRMRLVFDILARDLAALMKGAAPTE